MLSLSQAPHLGFLPSPHGAFQEHAAHITRWPVMLSSNGSSSTCILEVFRHSYSALSRRTGTEPPCAPACPLARPGCAPRQGFPWWTCASKRPKVSGRKWAARVEPHASSKIQCVIHASGQIPLPFDQPKRRKWLPDSNRTILDAQE